MSTRSIPIQQPHETFGKLLIGRVTSDKSDKTCRVEIDRWDTHPRYGKRTLRRTVCYVHDEYNECHCGDLVQIQESRPFSRLKRWLLTRIIEKASQEQRIHDSSQPKLLKAAAAYLIDSLRSLYQGEPLGPCELVYRAWCPAVRKRVFADALASGQLQEYWLNAASDSRDGAIEILFQHLRVLPVDVVRSLAVAGAKPRSELMSARDDARPLRFFERTQDILRFAVTPHYWNEMRPPTLEVNGILYQAKPARRLAIKPNMVSFRPHTLLGRLDAGTECSASGEIIDPDPQRCESLVIRGRESYETAISVVIDIDHTIEPSASNKPKAIELDVFCRDAIVWPSTLVFPWRLTGIAFRDVLLYPQRQGVTSIRWVFRIDQFRVAETQMKLQVEQ